MFILSNAVNNPHAEVISLLKVIPIPFKASFNQLKL
jgi:hypothetical protein